MTDRPPIPSPLWQRILAFLKSGATGQITIDVHQGRVRTVKISESFRDEDDAERRTA